MSFSSPSRAFSWACLLAALVTVLALGAPVQAEEATPTDQLKLMLIPVVSSYPAGSQLPLMVLLRMPQDKTLPAELKAGGEQGQVRLTLQAGDGVSLEEIRLTMPAKAGEPNDRMVVMGRLKVAAEAAVGPRLAECVLTLPPAVLGGARLEFSLPLEISAAGEKPEVVSPEMLARLGVDAALPSARPPDSGLAAAAPAAPSADDPLAKHSPILLMLLVFAGGLGLNLTPCVYPLIPITISFFGGRAQGSRGTLLVNALAYWLGMAVMYSGLGVAVSLSGGMLGEALTHPAVTIVLAAIILAMSASMFGFWEIRLPAFLTRVGASNRQGLGGAFFMGLTVGILAAPCLGPFVLGLMTHVASVGEVLYGLLVFLAFAAGLGLPLTALAFFSGSLTRLPGAGEWMIWVRKFFGVVLLLMAASIARPLIGDEVFRWLMAVVGIGGGIYLAIFEKSGKGRFLIFKRIAGGLMVVAAVAFWWLTAPQVVEQAAWKDWTPSAISEAAAAGKPSIVDFTASWCPPCRQMEAETFPDAKVQEAMAGFQLLRVDVSNGPPSPEAKALMMQWRVRGVPTIAFLDRQGKLMPELTIVGFVPPSDFLDRMRIAQAKGGPAQPAAPNAGGK